MARAILSLAQAIWRDKAADPAVGALWQLCRDLCEKRQSPALGELPVGLARKNDLGPVAHVLAGDERFSRDRLAAELGWELRHRLALEAITALVASDVSPVLCKGIAVAEAVYDAPWMRPMTDIDLLIEPPSLHTAIAALEGIGYRHQGPSIERSPFHHAITMRRDSSAVDLHRSIRQPLRDRVLLASLPGNTRPSLLFPGARLLSPAASLLCQSLFLARCEFVAPALRAIELHWMQTDLSEQDRLELRALVAVCDCERTFAAVRLVVAAMANGHRMRPALLPAADELLRQTVPTRAVRVARKLYLASSLKDVTRLAEGAVRERIFAAARDR